MTRALAATILLAATLFTPALGQSATEQARIDYEAAKIALEQNQPAVALAGFEKVIVVLGEQPELLTKAGQAALAAGVYDKANDYKKRAFAAADDQFKGSLGYKALVELSARLELRGVSAYAAVVDAQKVVQESRPGQAALARLKNMQDQLIDEMKAMQANIASLERDLQEHERSWSRKHLQEAKQHVDSEKAEFKAKQDGAQQTLQQAQGREFAALEADALAVIQRLGKERGFLLIFNKYQSALVYESIPDLSESVVRALNGDANSTTEAPPANNQLVATIDVDRLRNETSQGKEAVARAAAARSSGSSPADSERAANQELGKFETVALQTLNRAALDLGAGMVFRKSSAIVYSRPSADATDLIISRMNNTASPPTTPGEKSPLFGVVDLKQLPAGGTDAIRKVAEEMGLTVVFDKYESGLVYASDAMDITSKVSQKLHP